MADTYRLVLLLWTTVHNLQNAASAMGDRPPPLAIECGSTPNTPANISYIGNDIGALYTSGRQLQCHSERQRRGQSYAHVIYDVFGRDCGSERTEDGDYSITVHLQTGRESQRSRDLSTHVLSCPYEQTDSAEPHSDGLEEKRDVMKTTSLDPQLRPMTGKHRSRRMPQKKGKAASSAHGSGVAKPPNTLHKSGYASFNTEEMTSPPSVLQLNVIDRDGSMIAVVYPGKEVALELHTAHHTPFGVPVVTRCVVVNPLQDVHNDRLNPFSVIIMQNGCGLGDVLPQTSRFTKGKQGYVTPFFSVNPAWTTNNMALMFSCDVIICADLGQCHQFQSCPAQHQTAKSASLHDGIIVLDSQVVTSCPPFEEDRGQNDVDWSESLLPECLPEGYRPQQPMLPPEYDLNVTAAGASGSDVTKRLSASSWLAGHLQYVIIIGVLGLLIVVFMFATFCKMVAMQRQVLRSNKMAVRVQRERTTSEHHDQMTQTPRPLPRVPNGRSQTPNRLSRQGGDGASTTVIVEDGPGSRPGSGFQSLPPFDHPHEAPPHPPTVAQTRTSLQTRPKPPYDVPPNHDQQREIRASMGVSSPQGPVLFESSQRSSEVKSFQTRVEEKNSERHTTIIEIKTPGSKHDAGETSAPWKTHTDHLGSFTGNNPSSGSNTLERGVVLGVNSLRRHLDREHQQVSGQARDRRPISAQHQESVAAQVYYNTPAPCSEDSSIKELFKPSHEGAIPEHTALVGIRTSPHCGEGRKGITPVAVNTVEETTRL